MARSPRAGGAGGAPVAAAGVAAGAAVRLHLPRPLPKTWSLPPRYKAQDYVRRGICGHVCDAVDLETGCTVEVERITNFFFPHSRSWSKKLLHEVGILSQLQHEAIVKLHDIVPSNLDRPLDGELFLVTECCDSDLKKLFRIDGSLMLIHVNTVFYNLLLGLRYLHSAGVCHRDLKPATCLVNQDCAVKISGLGKSRSIKDRRHCSGPIEYGDVRYTAPERLLLQESCAETIDVWSAGCIFGELLGMLEGTNYDDRAPLFPGVMRRFLDSTHRGRPDNQLEKIFDLLGTPSAEDLAGWGPHSRQYIDSVAKRKGDGLAARFPLVDPNTLDLLDRMLRFNPEDRVTAAAALKHSALGEVHRAPSREVIAKTVVTFDFEEELASEEEQLRVHLRKLIRKYHPEVAQI